MFFRLNNVCIWIIYVMCCFILKCGSDNQWTQTVYMEGTGCGRSTIPIDSAVVYSHVGHDTTLYHANINCQLTFRAAADSWRLMARVVYMDIPDKTQHLCNDALYIFDSDTVMEGPLEEAGGIYGICGESLPPMIYSSGPFLTLYFRTDKSVSRGRGFKIIITSFNEDFEKYQSCGEQFLCGNNKCINSELTCDEVDHCGDFTDESAFGEAKCGQESVFARFLSLGITAAISITVGSLVVFVVCAVCIVCCCCRCIQRKPQDGTNGSPLCTNGNGPPGGGGGSSHGGSMVNGPHPTTTAATSVTINNGAPPTVNIPPHHAYHQTYTAPPPHQTDLHQPPQHGYYPLHQVMASQGPHPQQVMHPPGPGSAHSQLMYAPYPGQQPQQQGVVMSHPHAPSSVHTATPTMGNHGNSHHGSYGNHHSPQPGQGLNPRDSYSHPGSVYSSNPPPSYHRSYTPSSSRSCHSSDSVKYTVHDTTVTTNNCHYEKMPQPAEL